MDVHLKESYIFLNDVLGKAIGEYYWLSQNRMIWCKNLYQLLLRCGESVKFFFESR